MGDFGYLPRDVLSQIEYLFKLPEIDIIEDEYVCGPKTYSFCIKYQYVTIKLDMYPQFQDSDTRNTDINEFINDMDNNVDSSYREDDCENENYEEADKVFEIFYNNKREDIINSSYFLPAREGFIEIINRNTYVKLNILCKDQVIVAMRKYRDMCNATEKKEEKKDAH